MEELATNQNKATSQEAVQNQNEPQLRDENAHNDKSVHGVLNPTYQAWLRRDAVQPDIEAERKKRDEIEAGKSYCSRRFGGATCFFFSSRRRHTRCLSDWSSDVCSSDLQPGAAPSVGWADQRGGGDRGGAPGVAHQGPLPRGHDTRTRASHAGRGARDKIGRASCRERV